MKVSGFVLLILIWIGFSAPRCEATVYNSNGSAANVQQIHDTQAVDGDTITLPAGTFAWSSGVTITKGVILKGQTTTDSTNGTAVDNTIIQDSNARRRPGGYPFITVNSQAGKSYRITGLTFVNGSATTQNNNGAILLDGQSHAIRIDHNSFSNLGKEAVWIQISNGVYGVADHNVMLVSTNIATFHMDNGGDDNGDTAFAAPTAFGSDQFFFIEDNYIRASTNNPTGGPDDLRGGRWVWRHNHMFNVQVQSHGTEDGRWHGGRAREVYGNDFHFPRSFVGGIGGIRSGVTVFHDNTFDGPWPGDAMYQLRTYRLFFRWPACPFGGATGDNPWDSNDPHGLYESGTATNGSDSTHIIDSTKNWTPNQWTGYTAKFIGNNQVALIQSNTSNTLNVVFYTDSGGGHVWHAGDGYQIHRISIALDQPGRGQGDLIVGNPPINSRTGTPAWPNQALEPSYSWNNIYTPDGRHVNFTVGTGGETLVQGRDYYNNTAMPNYTPYAYPHPLVAGLRAVIADVNGDGSPDYVLYSAGTHQTAIWYMNNNAWIGSAYGPTLPNNWALRSATDFNGDGHSDYALFYPNGVTAIWYLLGPILIGGAQGPTLPSGWELIATADFNGDGKPDYVLYNASTRQTAIWYMNNNVCIGSAYGPTLPNGWDLIGVADFNRDGHMDYALFAPSTGVTAIWYLSGPTFIGGAYGPTLPSGWRLVATADFDRDGHPDFLVYNAGSYQTAIIYLNNNVVVNSASAPTLPAAWGWRAQ